MRIASVEVVPYALPFREPYVTAAGTLTEREMVLLRLHSDETAWRGSAKRCRSRCAAERADDRWLPSWSELGEAGRAR